MVAILCGCVLPPFDFSYSGSQLFNALINGVLADHDHIMNFVQHCTNFLDLRIQRTVKYIMSIVQSFLVAVAFREELVGSDRIDRLFCLDTSKYAYACQDVCSFLMLFYAAAFYHPLISATLVVSSSMPSSTVYSPIMIIS